MLRTGTVMIPLASERKIVRVMSLNQGWARPARNEARQVFLLKTSAIRGFKSGTLALENSISLQDV